MKQLFYIFTIFVFMIGLTGCSSRSPIYNVVHHPVPIEARKLTTQEIGQHIQRAVSRRNWVCSQISSNKLACRTQTRKRKAAVEIDYSQRSFSISYISTYRMRYKLGRIHPKYNKWIKLMERDIVRALKKPNY